MHHWSPLPRGSSPPKLHNIISIKISDEKMMRASGSRGNGARLRSFSAAQSATLVAETTLGISLLAKQPRHNVKKLKGIIIRVRTGQSDGAGAREDLFSMFAVLSHCSTPSIGCRNDQASPSRLTTFVNRTLSERNPFCYVYSSDSRRRDHARGKRNRERSPGLIERLQTCSQDSEDISSLHWWSREVEVLSNPLSQQGIWLG